MKDNPNGPSNTVDPKKAWTLPLEHLISRTQVREIREQAEKSFISHNKGCWKTWCKRNHVEF